MVCAMVEFAPARSGDTGCAVVAGGFIALVDVGVRADLIGALHARFAGGAISVEDAAAQLVDAVPDARFAIARVDVTPVRVALRGDLTVDMGASATTRFGWPTDGSWVIGEADDLAALRFALDAQDESPHRLPLHDGACPASAISASLTSEGSVSLRAADESTVLAPRPGSTPPPDDGGPSPSDALETEEEPGWIVTLPDGSELDASPRLVVGRRPWRSEMTDAESVYVAAPSPNREISGRHLELSVVGEQLLARDMGSTNGTLVLTQDRPARLLHGGRDAKLDSGDTLDLGEGFCIGVARRR